MKFIALLILSCSLALATQAQQPTPATAALIRSEDSLQKHAFNIIIGRNASDRFRSDSIFTRMLVRALRTQNSFYYPFDSLITISKLYAPDSSFRIFTWQMLINENVVRQHGAIQMKTENGELKLFPLIDKSDVTQKFEDTVANHYGWMGAVYYKIILTRASGKNFYTLLGFDENNIRSDKKIIEVLHFDDGEPVFGGGYFSVPNDGLKPSNPARYVMEFKKAAGPRLTYDEELQMIVMEHLVSESNEPKKKYTLVGDGDYEGFKWNNGRWIYVSKIFNEVTPDGQAPVPKPLAADHGVIKPEEKSEAAPSKPKKKN